MTDVTEKRKEYPALTCSQCGSKRNRNIRRTQVYKGVVLEDVPATYCPDCGEELYDAATVGWMEMVAADPQKYAQMIEMPVVRAA